MSLPNITPHIGYNFVILMNVAVAVGPLASTWYLDIFLQIIFNPLNLRCFHFLQTNDEALKQS